MIKNKLDNYYQFIEGCRDKVVNLYHNHHIIPKSMGGSDDQSNLIKLSYEDHQKAHILLSECFDKDSKEYKYNKLASQLLSSWADNPNVILSGWSHSEETKKKMSESAKSRVFSCDYINGFDGKKHTKEHKEYISKLNTLKSFTVIQQIGKDGKLIHEYTSLSDIKEKNPSFNKSNISHMLNGGNSKSVYGYIWTYKY
jgi:hypothetical protein